MTHLVKMTGIDKSAPDVQALKSVDFDLIAGEVHALMGETVDPMSDTGFYDYDASDIDDPQIAAGLYD